MADACSIGEEVKESNVPHSGDDKIELPSTIADRWRIFMPHDRTHYDPQIYGKWMWFNFGDFQLQDEVWTKLHSLLDSKCILLLESSTARQTRRGVIKCYTSQDKNDIIEAGLALQKTVNDSTLLFYKTTEASQDGLSRRSFDKFITKYMLTVNGTFYGRDYLDRWKMIDDGSSIYKESISCYQEMYLPPLKRQNYIDMEMLPSEESKKPKFSVGSHINRNSLEPVGMWHLFCSITDFDRNHMTELDRNWIQVLSLFNERVFLGASVETNAYFYIGGDANYRRRSITCDVKDYTDVSNVVETGLTLLKRCNYSFPIYMKTLRPTSSKMKFYMRYMLTKDGELYKYDDERWKLLVPSRR